jgi:YD repeat-containing protein
MTMTVLRATLPARTATATRLSDAAGNQNASADTIGPDNQLLSDGTWNYSYDNAGNFVSKTSISDPSETWTYTYDNNNQMLSAVETEGSTTIAAVTYTYDALSNRVEVETTQNGTTTTQLFAYDGTNVYADEDGSGNITTRYLWGSQTNALEGRVTSTGTASFAITDYQGSVRAWVGSTGAVQDEINYDAYGNITSESNASDGSRYTYVGYQWDAVTGEY